MSGGNNEKALAFVEEINVQIFPQEKFGQ